MAIEFKSVIISEDFFDELETIEEARILSICIKLTRKSYDPISYKDIGRFYKGDLYKFDVTIKNLINKKYLRIDPRDNLIYLDNSKILKPWRK